MATVAVPNKTKLKGGSFLIEEHTTEQVFTLEDLSEEHQQIAQTTQDFAKNEILPNAEKIEHKEFAVTRALIKKACEIGIGNVTHRLSEGDCLAMQLGQPTTFRNRTRRPARYLVVLATGFARGRRT